MSRSHRKKALTVRNTRHALPARLCVLPGGRACGRTGQLAASPRGLTASTLQGGAHAGRRERPRSTAGGREGPALQEEDTDRPAQKAPGWTSTDPDSSRLHAKSHGLQSPGRMQQRGERNSQPQDRPADRCLSCCDSCPTTSPEGKPWVPLPVSSGPPSTCGGVT